MKINELIVERIIKTPYTNTNFMCWLNLKDGTMVVLDDDYPGMFTSHPSYIRLNPIEFGINENNPILEDGDDEALLDYMYDRNWCRVGYLNSKNTLWLTCNTTKQIRLAGKILLENDNFKFSNLIIRVKKENYNSEINGVDDIFNFIYKGILSSNKQKFYERDYI